MANRTKTNFITGTGTFCTRNSLSFYPHTRTVTPQYLPPSITDSVTTLSRHTVSHLSSSVKPSSFQENLKTKKTGDSSHTNPPLACSTPQYAARVTRKTEHECAEKEPELPNLLVLVWTPCSPASSHLARPRLHLHNGRRRPARQERTVRLSRLVSFHALLLSPQCHTTGPGYGPRTAR